MRVMQNIKDYKYKKQRKYKKMREKRGNKGQVTIFIILAIVIVAVLLIIFYPRIKNVFIPVSPSIQVEDCVTKELGNFVQDLASQGGSLEPENFILYNDKKIDYLCYTNEYYKTCVMQQPFIKQKFEEEVAKFISAKAKNCVQELVDSFESKGYSVDKKPGNVSVEIAPKNLKIIVSMPLTLTKETSETFDKFVISKPGNMYEILIISQAILNYEARYGDSVPEDFMLLYPNLRIQKLKQADGSKIYIVEDRDTKDSFTFATRSLSWPEGYGTQEQYVKV